MRHDLLISAEFNSRHNQSKLTEFHSLSSILFLRLIWIIYYHRGAKIGTRWDIKMLIRRCRRNSSQLTNQNDYSFNYGSPKLIYDRSAIILGGLLWSSRAENFTALMTQSRRSEGNARRTDDEKAAEEEKRSVKVAIVLISYLLFH